MSSESGLVQDGGGCDIHDLDGGGLGDLWAVGEDGVILRYGGEEWVQVVGASETLRAISNSVAVGVHGAVLLREGDGWIGVDAGIDETFNDVWYGGVDGI